MATIKDDIGLNASWIVDYFKRERILLDYSIDSFRSIDIFFDQHQLKHAEKNTENTQQILFSLGAYIGETILKNIPGSTWIDADDGITPNLCIQLPNGKVIAPMQKIRSKFEDASEDGIYNYAAAIFKEVLKDNYWNNINNNFQWLMGGRKWELSDK
ncbi:MAG: hypothetical protein JST75_22250 [Bacteroidetes bacterium]|nr:hypothetical protein [Bacteroidota bacterium]